MTNSVPRVSLPEGFTATKYEGYYWDTTTQDLYSLKQGGYLRKMKRQFPNVFNNAPEPFYGVYDKGRRRWLLISYLKELKVEESVIPFGESPNVNNRRQKHCSHSSSKHRKTSLFESAERR